MKYKIVQVDATKVKENDTRPEYWFRVRIYDNKDRSKLVTFANTTLETVDGYGEWLEITFKDANSWCYRGGPTCSNQKVEYLVPLEYDLVEELKTVHKSLVSSQNISRILFEKLEQKNDNLKSCTEVLACIRMVEFVLAVAKIGYYYCDTLQIEIYDKPISSTKRAA